MDNFKLTFNEEIIGSSLVTNLTNTLALRSKHVSSNGILLSNRPILPNELFLIEIAKKDYTWCGNLRIGVISKNIYEDGFSLPETSIPELENQLNNGPGLLNSCHLVAITKEHNHAPKENQAYDVLEIYPGYSTNKTKEYLKTKWQKPTWDELSYLGERLQQQYLEARLGEKDRENNMSQEELPKNYTAAKMNVDVGSRIGVILRPCVRDKEVEDRLLVRSCSETSLPGSFKSESDDAESDDDLALDSKPWHANMHIIINGRDQGVIKRNIVINDLKNPNYVLVDCYAQTMAVRIIPVRSDPPPLTILARDELLKSKSLDEIFDVMVGLPDGLRDFIESGVVF